MVMCDGSIKTFQQTMMKMKKSISCQSPDTEIQYKNTVYKGFRSIVLKQRFQTAGLKIVFFFFFCVFETLFSGRKNPRFFLFQESRKIRNGYSSNGYIEFKTMFPDSSQMISLDIWLTLLFLDIFKKNTDSWLLHLI